MPIHRKTGLFGSNARSVPSLPSMLSLSSNSRAQEIPRGVVAIAALCCVLSGISLALTALLLAGTVPLSTGAALLGGGMEQLGPPAFLLYGAILAVVGTALWRRWRGARRTAILLAGAGIALVVPGISSAVADGRLLAIFRDGTQIIVRVLVIYYLSQEPVREWFTSR